MAIVRPDPLVATVPVGGQVVVNIYVQDVQNLYGADIRFSYDPAVLEVQVRIRRRAACNSSR